MTSKIAAALAALAFATAAHAASLVAPMNGEGIGESAVQQIRLHRFGRHYFRCPAWYEPTFWGSWRLYSPCSNRVTLGQY